MNYKIMSNNLTDTNAIEQIKSIACAFNDNNIVIMPDYHAGKGCVIGFTMELKDSLNPDLIGVDLGCGILGFTFSKQLLKLDLEKLDNIIKTYIPTGKEVNPIINPLVDLSLIHNIPTYTGDRLRIFKSLGTLGSGNHFIEVSELEHDYMITIHTGSRNLGVQIYKYWKEVAEKSNRQRFNTELKELLNSTEPKLRQQVKEEFKSKYKHCSLLFGNDLKGYLKDLDYAQKFAKANRLIILKIILRELGLSVNDGEIIDSVHNYVDLEYNIVRKGSISAQLGEKVLIPINMRDGIIIGAGKGNKDWNYSAPHGAGRVMSRTEAKNNVTLEQFQESMQGIYTSCISNATIDESPMAYKPIEEILSVIRATVDIIEIAKPIYNFKGV